jgi:hypothetical protein
MKAVRGPCGNTMPNAQPFLTTLRQHETSDLQPVGLIVANLLDAIADIASQGHRFRRLALEFRANAGGTVVYAKGDASAV